MSNAKFYKYNMNSRVGFIDRQMNNRGCTMVTEPETERYSRHSGARGEVDFMYDYRHTNGELFSCTAPTLEQCKKKRDAWLEENGWTLPPQVKTLN